MDLMCVLGSDVVFKMKEHIFLDTFTIKMFLSCNTNSLFRGDLADVSAKKATLVLGTIQGQSGFKDRVEHSSSRDGNQDGT